MKKHHPPGSLDKLSTAIMFFIVVVFSATVLADGLIPLDRPIDRRDSAVTMTRWADPEGSLPLSRRQWLLGQPPRVEFKSENAGHWTPLPKTRETVMLDVVVNADLYPQIESSLDQFIMDLTGEGYEVALQLTSGGSPTEFRDALAVRYQQGMQGCVLIGDFPVPWYETDYGSPPEHAEFPTDLFYMDLDGYYADADFDGLYDFHSGDVAPEIWMGRLTASPLTYGGADETTMLTTYFDKNHRYRSDRRPVNNRALVYVEDDWHYWSDMWDLDVGRAFNQRTFVKDKYVTFAPDYENRLDDNYELVQVCVHSWPAGHQFTNPVPQYSYTYFYELFDIRPVAHFYNLFACSNALYVETDYMSGWYIFGDDYGLAAIGSAKSGSMLEFGDFYEPLGRGECIGRAFLDWFTARAEGGFDESEVTWFYGMTLNGDPTLKTQSRASTDILQHDNGVASYVLTLPSESWDRFSVRFTAEEEITLNRVTAEGSFPDDAEGTVYVCNSDGLYPTSIIDSVLVKGDQFSSVDLSPLAVSFSAGQQFQIVYCWRAVEGQADTVQFYMDDGNPSTDHSSVRSGGVWKRLSDIWGIGYNFCIRVEAVGPAQPSIEITTDDLVAARAGQAYSEELKTEGGTGILQWSLAAGALPPGIVLDAESGKLDGVTSNIGEFPFSVRVEDSSDPGLTDVQHLALSVRLACGDANADGSGPDILDLVYLVTYMFQGGPPPPQIELVDIDNSGSGPDIADLVYLVSYMFQGGPAPSCGG